MPEFTTQTLYEYLRNSPESGTPLITSLTQEPYHSGGHSGDMFWEDRDIPIIVDGKPWYVLLRIRIFIYPLRGEYWATDVEIFLQTGKERWIEQVGTLLYHRERAWKGKERAWQDVEEIIKKFQTMTVREFADMAEPTQGKLASRLRDLLYRLAAVPPFKRNPPKDKFPGDTIKNEWGGGSGSLASGEPFGAESGLHAAPMQRGELEFRPSDSIGIPLQPISPTVNDDDTRRRKRVPPIYRPERGPLATAYAVFTKTAEDDDPLFFLAPQTEEWEQERVPPDLWSAWRRAHDAIQDAERKSSLQAYEQAAQAVAIFAGKAKKYLAPAQVEFLTQKLQSLDELLLRKDVVEGRSSPLVYIDGILNSTHSMVSRMLQVDPWAWYEIGRRKQSAEQSGVFDTHEPVSFDVQMPGPQRQLSGKVAVDVSPIPKDKKDKGEEEKHQPLLLEMPRDLRERFADFARRVVDYAKSIGEYVGSLDAYQYHLSPPREWVEKELPHVFADLDDIQAWKKYLGRCSHIDLADLGDFSTADPSTISPTLYTQWVVSAGNHDFGHWFTKTKPNLDDSLVVFLRDKAKSRRDHPLVQGYNDWWRKRYLGKLYSQAYHRAKDKWKEYIANSGTEFAKEEYKSALETLAKVVRGEPVPVGDLVDALYALPFTDEYRADVDRYKSEFDSLIHEGMSALDLAHAPISREDRLYGDLIHEGFRWVPTSRVLGVPVKPMIRASSASIPVPLYQYGSMYYLVHDTDADKIAGSYVWADVTRIVPGSSIQKRYIASIDEFTKKSKALANAIYDIQNGEDKEAVFLKYGRVFGPGLRKAVSDYFYVQSLSKKSADGESDDSGGDCSTFWAGQTHEACRGCTFYVPPLVKSADSGGPSGSGFGDSIDSNIHEQSADNAGGADVNPTQAGWGEYGYGFGGCLLTHLFLNAPSRGFGKGDEPPGYDPDHTPGTPSLQKQNSRVQIKTAQVVFRQVPAEQFYAAIERAKTSPKVQRYLGFLSGYSLDDYRKMRTYLSTDEQTGYAITPENDLVSVFNASPIRGAGAAAVEHALSQGAETLDAFEGFLTNLYTSKGFVEYKRVPFSEEMAPKEWDVSQFGKPDVVFMRRKRASKELFDLLVRMLEGENFLPEPGVPGAPEESERAAAKHQEKEPPIEFFRKWKLNTQEEFEPGTPILQGETLPLRPDVVEKTKDGSEDIYIRLRKKK